MKIGSYLSSPAARLSNVSLFVCLAFASFTTVLSIYLDSFVHNASMVGLIVGFMGLVSIAGYVFFTPFIEKYSESKIWIMAALFLIVSFFLLFLVRNIFLVILAIIVFVLAKVLYTEVQGIMICDACKRKDLGKGVGFYGSLKNMGYVLGPIIAGSIAVKLGIPFVYLFCGIFVLMAFIMFESIKIHQCHHRHNGKRAFGSDLTDFFRTSKLVKAYLVSGGVPFYWGIIYIFGPLFMIRNGFSGSSVGLFLFFVAIPMVILSYSMGRMADSIGYRMLFITGHLIMAACLFISFIANDVFVSLVFLALGSIGTSLVESPRESYFFSKVKRSEEQKYYGPYMTHGTLFEMLSQILGGVILLFFPLKFVFLFLSLVMIFFAGISAFVRR